MKKQITLNDSNWTGNESTITADVVGDHAEWSHNGYNWSVDVTVMPQYSWDEKNDEQWIVYELNGEGWDEPLTEKAIVITKASEKGSASRVMEAVAAAHEYISNYV